MIHYQQSGSGNWKIRSWEDMVREIDQFLLPYRRPQNASLCPSIKNNSTSESVVCLFDMNAISQECLKPNYGYPEGRPCIFVVFNNISDWVPSTPNPSSNVLDIDCQSKLVEIFCNSIIIIIFQATHSLMQKTVVQSK